VAISIDISTAFLGSEAMDHYYAAGISPEESRRRQEVFSRLANRQKGTEGHPRISDRIDYEYLATSRRGVLDKTCGRTPELKVNGKSYNHYLILTRNAIPKRT